MPQPLIPLFSVIIPVFNSSHNLFRICQYFLLQTYPETHCDVNIIDDHSNCNLRAFAERFGVIGIEPKGGSSTISLMGRLAS